MRHQPTAFALPKGRVEEFFQRISSWGTVYGSTVREGKSGFFPVSRWHEVRLDGPRPFIPPKKLFFPPEIPLFSFRRGRAGYEIEDRLEEMHEKRVLLGLRLCDARGIARMDLYLMGDVKDPYYVKMREDTLLIGVTCTTAHSSCFCTLFGGLDRGDVNYDLWLTDVGDAYLVEVGSERGSALLEGADFLEEANGAHITEAERRRRYVEDEVRRNLPAYDHDAIFRAFSECYNDALWEWYAERCLACGKCNFICPTCHCFDVYDEVGYDLNEGRRMRKWDACHLYMFAAVHGHNFRGERSARVKYRVYDKFYYPRERYGVFTCVGCGRCFDTCSARIDLRDILREVMM